MRSKKYTNDDIIKIFKSKISIFPIPVSLWTKNGLPDPFIIRDRFGMKPNEFLEHLDLPIKRKRIIKRKNRSKPNSKISIVKQESNEMHEPSRDAMLDKFFSRQYLFPLEPSKWEENGLPAPEIVEKEFGMTLVNFLEMLGFSDAPDGSIKKIVTLFERNKHLFPMQPQKWSRYGLPSPEEMKKRFRLEPPDILSIMFDEMLSKEEKIEKFKFHEVKHKKNNMIQNDKGINIQLTITSEVVNLIKGFIN